MRIAKVIVQAAVGAAFVAMFMAGFGCQQENPIGNDCDPAKSTCTPVAAPLEEPITQVDILFVMDKSQSMVQEQAKLAVEMPKLVKALVTGDLDGDGAAEMEPADSVHLGVVTSDIGIPKVNQGDSPYPQFCVGVGDDGLLVHAPHPTIAGFNQTPLDCAKTYPTFLAFGAGDSVDKIATDFQCIAGVGPYGCGFEQSLEAMLKALWPSTDNKVTFLAGHGHGDVENKNFLREGSLLAVVVVSDADDCSAGALGNLDFLKSTESANLPEWMDETQANNLNLRCYYDSQRPKAEQNKWPITRYVKNLQALRPGREDRVIFGVIAGVPTELVDKNSSLPEHILGNVKADSTDVEEYYQKILDDPAMREKEDANKPGYLVKACTLKNPDYNSSKPESSTNDPNLTAAEPARRLVAVAKAFGVNGVVQSICEESYTAPVETLILAITNRIQASVTK